jgi:hypothetical protein
MGGPDDKDKFVVFADAANVNNLILYWRDEIPADWKQIPGTSSRRIAGLLPVNFGDESLSNSYSENSATIFDYGAVLANNQVKTDEKMMLDVQLKMKDPKRTPYGVQKFQWDGNGRSPGRAPMSRARIARRLSRPRTGSFTPWGSKTASGRCKPSTGTPERRARSTPLDKASATTRSCWPSRYCQTAIRSLQPSVA